MREVMKLGFLKVIVTLPLFTNVQMVGKERIVSLVWRMVGK
jgi:hypothetical protein